MLVESALGATVGASVQGARSISNIFVLTGDIGGQGQRKGRTGWGKQTQDPEGQRREKLHRSNEEQERNGNGIGRTRDKAGRETRTTATRREKIAEQARGGRCQERHNQVSSNGEGGEYRVRGAGQEDSADESAEWSSAESKGLAMEEEATSTGGAEWER